MNMLTRLKINHNKYIKKMENDREDLNGLVGVI